jgi:hypothetical protein
MKRPIIVVSLYTLSFAVFVDKGQFIMFGESGPTVQERTRDKNRKQLHAQMQELHDRVQI